MLARASTMPNAARSCWRWCPDMVCVVLRGVACGVLGWCCCVVSRSGASRASIARAIGVGVGVGAGWSRASRASIARASGVGAGVGSASARRRRGVGSALVRHRCNSFCVPCRPRAGSARRRLRPWRNSVTVGCCGLMKARSRSLCGFSATAARLAFGLSVCRQFGSHQPENNITCKKERHSKLVWLMPLCTRYNRVHPDGIIV